MVHSRALGLLSLMRRKWDKQLGFMARWMLTPWENSCTRRTEKQTIPFIYESHVVINYAQIDVNVIRLSVCKLKNAQSKLFVWKKPKQINTQLHEDTQECLQSKTHPRAWQTHPQPTSNRSPPLVSAPSLTHSFYQPQGNSTINDHADDRLSGCVCVRRGLGCGQMVCVRVCECESLREAAHGSGDREACLGGLWVKTRRSAFRPVLQHKGSCVGLRHQQLWLQLQTHKPARHRGPLLWPIRWTRAPQTTWQHCRHCFLPGIMIGYVISSGTSAFKPGSNISDVSHVATRDHILKEGYKEN